MGPQRRGVRWLHEMNNDATYGICAPFLYRTRPAATNVDQDAHSYGRHISTLYITTLEEVFVYDRNRIRVGAVFLSNKHVQRRPTCMYTDDGLRDAAGQGARVARDAAGGGLSPRVPHQASEMVSNKDGWGAPTSKKIKKTMGLISSDW
jgi:hypothetical protein